MLDFDGNLSTDVLLTDDINSTAPLLRMASGDGAIGEEGGASGQDVGYELLYVPPTEIVVLLSIFYGAISIISIIGNSLVIWVVATTRQMHTVTNMYIANLAFADVIIGTFCIPFQFQAALLQRWNFPEFLCTFSPFVQVVSVNVSVFTLTAIAVDRHRAIINPLRARPTRFKSKMIILAIWVAALSFATPCAIAFRVTYPMEEHLMNGIIYNVTRPFCDNVNLSAQQLLSYRYNLMFVQYVVPLTVISFVYIQMAVRLWGSRTPGNAQDARDITLLRNKKKVIKMLIIVVVVFGICWLPLQMYNILYVTLSDLNEYRFINIIWFCCDWLAMSNSCCNPFIYGIYNEKFKREFNKRFSACFCKFTTNGGTEQNERTISVHTRASSVRSTYTAKSSTRIRNNCLVQQPSRAALSTTGSKSNGTSFIRKKENGGDIKNNNVNFFDLTTADTENCILNEVPGAGIKTGPRKAILTNGFHQNSIVAPFKQADEQIPVENCKDFVQSSSCDDFKRNSNISTDDGDGLRKHKGRIVDTNRNRIICSAMLTPNTQGNISEWSERSDRSDITEGNSCLCENELELAEINSGYPLLSRPKNNDNSFYNL